MDSTMKVHHMLITLDGYHFMRATPDVPQAEDQLTLSETAIQHMLGEVGAAVNPGLAWAGASHWRYRTRAALRPAAASEEEGSALLPAKAPTK